MRSFASKFSIMSRINVLQASETYPYIIVSSHTTWDSYIPPVLYAFRCCINDDLYTSVKRFLKL